MQPAMSGFIRSFLPRYCVLMCTIKSMRLKSS